MPVPDVSSTFRVYQPELGPAPQSVPLLACSGVDWRAGLVVRAPNWLGDTLMALPAVQRMRDCLPPGCGVTVVCPAALAAIWTAVPWVSGVIPMPARRVRGTVAQAMRAIDAGVGVVLPNSVGAALDLFHKGIPCRLGRRGHGRGLLLTHALPCWRRGETVGRVHHAARYLEIAHALGAGDWSVSCSGPQVADAPAIAADLGMHADDGPWLAMAPGAAYGPAKQWPATHFAHVAAWWQARGGRVILVGGARERQVGEQIAAQVPGIVQGAGTTSLTQLMAVLQSARVAVANDSGAMHLAAMLGTPGVALFGSTDPVSTGPLGAPWIVVRSPQYYCGPCFARVCPRTDAPNICLCSIVPERVCDALDFMMHHTSPTASAP